MQHTHADDRPATTEPETVSLSGLCRRLQIAESTAYRLIRTPGALPDHFRIGNQYRFTAAAIDRWIQNRTAATVQGEVVHGC